MHKKIHLFNSYLAFFLIASFVLSCCFSCKTKTTETVTPEVAEIPTNVAISEVFKFNTVKQVTLNLSAVNNGGEVLNAKSIVILAYKQGSPERDTLASGGVTTQGVFSTLVNVPTYVSKLCILPNYPGLLDSLIISLGPNSETISASMVPVKQTGSGTYDSNLPLSNTSGYVALSAWDNYGFPSVINSPNSSVEIALLESIHQSLPESRSVLSFNPGFITDNADILLTQGAVNTGVSVTFVHEGLKSRGSLGYYIYNRNSPPNSLDDLQGLVKKIIFPNCSYPGNGGNLESGTTVAIGDVPPNYGIGFLYMPDAYKNGQNVDTTVVPIYSNALFNKETTPSIRQHAIQFSDPNTGRIIMAFEESNRDNVDCDNDFNDAIFYVTFDQRGAADLQNAKLFATATDTDNDGVDNYSDQYPNNDKLAYKNYFPGSNKFGTVCFEDRWPSTDDYDFNDLVLNYNYNVVTNAQNKVVQLHTRFVVKAFGATNSNGLGFQLNLPPSEVKAVTDIYPANRFVNPDRIVSNPITGTENSQSKATFILYDSPDLFVTRTGGVYFNTQNEYKKGKTIEMGMNIEFLGPQEFRVLGNIPYNPFIYTNKAKAPFSRGTEVHLIDNNPTDLVNRALFGTLQDRTNQLADRYYRANNNMPFAMYFPIDWQYPIEKANITSVYPKFMNWASTNGAQNMDWYLDLPGNQVKARIYSK